MANKIIKKEKDRQDRYFIEIKEVSEPNKNYIIGKMDCHKQSLINLKEYLEELLEMVGFTVIKKSGCEELSRHKFEEDIKELTKMIGRYE